MLPESVLRKLQSEKVEDSRIGSLLSYRGRSSVMVVIILVLGVVSGTNLAAGWRIITWPFSYSPSNPIVGTQVSFTTGCYNTPPCSYSWNFGDGSTSTAGASVTHAYTSSGTFTVTLNAQDSQDTGGSSSQTITVAACYTVPLDFTYSPSNAASDQPVTFTANRPGPCGLEWQFGDGSTNSNNQVVTHSYSNGGSYSVRLFGEDYYGNPISTQHAVVVGWKECAGCGHRPSDSFDYYKVDRPDHPFAVSNSQSFPDGSPAGAVGLGLGVEVVSYYHNYAGSGFDRYVLAVVGSGTSRLAHQYSSPMYSSTWDMNQCPGSPVCVDLGITTLNGGAWLDIGSRPMYFYGVPFTKVFVCSNGYIAFVYSLAATTCPANPTSFPARATDSQGVPLNIPDAIIAPLWKPLDPRVSTAHIYYQPFVPAIINDPNRDPRFGVDTIGFTWVGLQTQGCSSCMNTFSLSMDSEGNIYFSYPTNAVSASDTTPATAGVEDASGTLSTVANTATALSTGGVKMTDPKYKGSPPQSLNFPDYNYAYLQGLELKFKDLTPADGAAVNPTGNPLGIYGYNIRLTDPEINYLKDDLTSNLLGSVAEVLVLAAVCALPIPPVACLAISLGEAGAKTFYDSYRRWPSAPDPQLFTAQTMTGSTDGLLQMPVQEQDNLCGFGYFKDANGQYTSTPFHACAADARIYDLVNWDVPMDTSVHKLSISVGVVEGTTYCCVSFASTTSALQREGATVTLQIDPGDFSVSASTAFPSAITPGSSLTSTITMGSVNYYQSSVTLTPTGQSNGITATLNPTSRSLLAGGSATSTLTVTTSTSTPPGQYSVTVTGKDASGGVSHSVTIPFTVTDFIMCCSNSWSIPTGGAQSSTGVSVNSLGGFSGTVTLQLSTTIIGDSTVSLNPTSITLGPGQGLSSTLTITSGSQTGTYTFTVTGTSGSLTHSLTYTVTIYKPSGGGGGSVARGTLITMADGSLVPVQNVVAGDQMLGYDPKTEQFTVSTVTAIWTMTTDNMLVIHTGQGAPFRTDANPHQTLYVKTTDGFLGWLPVTQIKVGDGLFTPDGWTNVIAIDYMQSGHYMMYDMIATTPYFASGYLDPIYKV